MARTPIGEYVYEIARRLDGKISKLEALLESERDNLTIFKIQVQLSLARAERQALEDIVARLFQEIEQRQRGEDQNGSH